MQRAKPSKSSEVIIVEVLDLTYLEDQEEEALKAKRHERYLANREQVKARTAAYRKAHPEEAKAAVRKWRQENLEYARSKEAEYYAANAEERRAGVKKWREENKEYVKKAKREYSIKKRAEAITGYGGKCVCCGETIPRFLTISPVTTKAEAGYSGRPYGDPFHLWLIKNNFPASFRLLCWNCNLGAVHNSDGLCPHKSTAPLIDYKKAVIDAYGGVCECCGEKDPRLLTIDHINNDGAGDRNNDLWSRLRSLGYPKDRYRLLCWNCNSGRSANGGTCPHKEA